MQRLQELPLSCPSLRRLSLDIHVPRGGCVMEELTAQYCGLGLSNGEKLPALQELEIVEYPWGHQSTRKTAGSDPASAETLFRYMREYSSGKHPPLQRLHVSSLSDVYRNLHWAKHNSTSFIVHKSSAGGGHGGGAPEKVTVSCTELREEPNEKMRRVVRGEAVPTPEVMSWINFKVALGGPMSEEQLTLMRRTDRMVNDC
ncbi:hypothetical protein NKR19_g2019 [Coniochaeta hoffmannii]|uniref:Uncharacterized protein n=1 Tax=Coniochaeta hoffmannii TaxID=91930 RepID=A0AA38VSK7_9PEZI|nr:hypothetical protein NKR19_g2019 [Coniochaeta hoffmannii]